MRAILINAAAQTVTEVDTTGELQDLYRLVECSHVQTVAIEATTYSATPHDIWVDEESLLGEPEFFFVWEGNPIAGNGLILGCNDEGECVACELPLDAVQRVVTFKRLTLEGFEPVSGRVDHPITGPDTPVIGSRAVFSERPSDTGGIDWSEGGDGAAKP